MYVTVTFRPGATSTTDGPWLCLGTRNERCCHRNCVTGAFEGRGGELISNYIGTQSSIASLLTIED
jgi:hypothetical protein